MNLPGVDRKISGRKNSFQYAAKASTATVASGGPATVAVLAFAAYWNEFFRPLIFLSTPGKFTLPLGLVTLQGYLGTGSVSVVLAGVMLSLIPTLIVFLFAQRRLVEGLTLGSVKG